MSAHARLGPSNHRWPNCAGSVREESGYTEVAGAAAIDGTGSHLLLEMCLDNGVRAEQYEGQIIGAGDEENPMGWLVASDRCERVQMCLDYVDRRVNELRTEFPDSEVMVEAESKSDPGGMGGRDDWWGTVDITITVVTELSGADFIEIIDYKDGRGWVDEKNNSQLQSYAIGKMRPFIASGPGLVRPFHPQNVGGVRMTIVQPKTNPVVRYQDTTANELLNHYTRLKSAARATDNPDAPVTPGKHCQWCKANPKRGGHCMASTDESLKVMKKMSTDDIAPQGDAFEYIAKVVADPKSLTEAQLSELMSAKDALLVAFDKCEREITDRIEAGITVPGYAMQPGRNSGVWNLPDDEIEKKLKARRLKLTDIYPKKLISVAQVMKLDALTDTQKKKIEADLVTVKAGKMTLKKVAHETAAEMFPAEPSFL